MKFFIASIAGFLSGIAGAMGLGGGSVLLIYLTVFAGVEQLKAQGINLLFFIPIALLSTIIYAKRGVIMWKRALIMAAFGVAGTLLGSFIITLIKPGIIKEFFGGLVLIYGLIQLFSPKNKKDKNTNKNTA